MPYDITIYFRSGHVIELPSYENFEVKSISSQLAEAKWEQGKSPVQLLNINVDDVVAVTSKPSPK